MRPTAHPAVEFVVFDDPDLRVVVFDERSGTTHEFNSSASVIWLLCDGQSTIAEVEQELSELFEVPRDLAASDVGAALRLFSDAHLLATSERAVAADEYVSFLPRPPDP